MSALGEQLAAASHENLLVAIEDDAVPPPPSSAADIAAAANRARLVCFLVACTGFFHGYDNGVVNGVFEMPSFRHRPPAAAAAFSPCRPSMQRLRVRAHVSCVLTAVLGACTGDNRDHMGWPTDGTQTTTVALHQGLTVNGFNAGEPTTTIKRPSS